jgi:hypothetical protein
MKSRATAIRWPGTRVPWRDRHSWSDNIKMDLKEAGCEDMNCTGIKCIIYKYNDAFHC